MCWVLPESSTHTAFSTSPSSCQAVKATPANSRCSTPPLASVGRLHTVSMCPLLPHLRHSASRNLHIAYTWPTLPQQKHARGLELMLLTSKLPPCSLVLLLCFAVKPTPTLPSESGSTASASAVNLSFWSRCISFGWMTSSVSSLSPVSRILIGVQTSSAFLGAQRNPTPR